MDLLHESLTRKIVGGAIRVHRTLGPGLLESVYELCLASELIGAGLRVERQFAVPVHYRDVHIEAGYRVDFLIDDQILVELKTVARVLPVHEAQLLTYLHLTSCPVGLLINFNVPRLTDGIVRRVLETASKRSTRIPSPRPP